METQYFDIVAGVLQGDMLAPYLFIICLDYVLRTLIDKIRENGFELKKKRSRILYASTQTLPNEQDSTQGCFFFNGIQLEFSFPSPKPVSVPRLKNPVSPTIYL